MQRPIYLDNHATTPLDRRVLDAMMPYLCEEYGNAASTEHRYGWVAEEAVARARDTIAAELGAASPSEILFTSGATESNNLAIWGAARTLAAKGNHIVTLTTEHKAVLDPVAAWVRAGGRATVVPVGSDGLVDLDRLADAVREDTVLVSVMYANNEIGVVQPIRAIGALARDKGVLFHCDAAQAVGKLPVHVGDDGIHLLSVSAHKIYGPKGMGALYVRRRAPRVALTPLMYGGGHERGMRSGTLNVPGIVGLAEALRLCASEREDEAVRLTALRRRLWAGLTATFDGLLLNGHETHRLPRNLNVAFPQLPIADLVREGYGTVALSTGAACTSADPGPSHVLAALDEMPERRAQSSVRFGLGRFTTEADIDTVLACFRSAEALRRFRRKL